MSWHTQPFRFGSRKSQVSTAVQANKLLAFIVAYQREHGGVSPSFPDMAAGIGVASKGHVHKVMAKLVADRKIRTLPHRARAIEVIPQEIPGDPQDTHYKPLAAPGPYAEFFKVVREGDEVKLVPMEVER